MEKDDTPGEKIQSGEEVEFSPAPGKKPGSYASHP